MDNVWWWHSIDLGDDITPGRKTAEQLESEWASLKLPPLVGKTVLDVGCWDGWFSFRAEREGAARVVALDHYVWSLDLPAHQNAYESGTLVTPDQFVRPGLPGKQGFDIAHRLLGSRVEAVVGSIHDITEQYDVVLFLGVLYHLEEPLTALRHLRAVTREVAAIETVATNIDSPPVCEFFPGRELDGDPTNWWAPNETGLHALCRAAGFTHVVTIAAPPPRQRDAHYRLVVHASHSATQIAQNSGE